MQHERSRRKSGQIGTQWKKLAAALQWWKERKHRKESHKNSISRRRRRRRRSWWRNGRSKLLIDVLPSTEL